MGELYQGIRDKSPWYMLFADDIVLCSTNRGVVESKLEQWGKALEDRGLKISRKKTEYLSFNEDRDSEISMEGTRMNIKVKGRVYKTVVRPALMYGAETWPVKRVQEKKLNVGRDDENAQVDVWSNKNGQDQK
ncbi:uncharacterized protein [Macrobrachium rosenbergii]|uniref:uncharacterized protein n=1 Tax=Macrobrachium rosenbergii TaxID=79674 RepID=UPI0034D6BBD3